LRRVADLRARVNHQLSILRQHPRVRQFLPSAARIAQHELVDRAGALTYYGLLGIIPALLAFYALLGLLGTDTTVQDAIGVLGNLLPGDSDAARQKFVDLLQNQANSIPLLGLGILGILWTASAFVGSFFRASATIWAVKRRPLWQAWPGRVAVTIVLLILVVIAAIAIVVTGELAQSLGGLLGLTQVVITLYEILKWPAVLLLLVVIIATLYASSPHPPHRVRVWRGITPGVVFAVVAWLVVSGLYTLYVQLFGSYETTYGALGTTIASMVWLWQSNLVLLSGLTVDAELYAWEGPGG
jgi:membrane protein